MEKTPEQLEAWAWAEYDAAACWCAKRGIRGDQGDSLPINTSTRVVELINEDIEAFKLRVRQCAYELAMNERNL